MNNLIVIVGAGPAGLSAAIEAARAGARVLLLDENQKPGGQLFKQIHKFFGSEAHKAGTRGVDIGRQLLAETEASGAEVRLGYPVYGVYPDGRVVFGSAQGVQSVLADRVILATGATENCLCFEGSTLPGVMTAGAAQTFINEHRVLPGSRVVMIGSGNVGLIISYQLMQAGAEVVALAEAAPAIGGYAVHAAKLRRAGVPILLSHTVNRVFGDGRVQKVELVQVDEHFQKVDDTQTVLDADTVCMAVGLTPMVELAALAGCAFCENKVLGGTVPVHDADMRTTNPLFYVAGDISGVEEASTAIEEGRLAGVAAAQSLGFGSRDAEERKAALRQSLDSLRSGAFGEKRRSAKEEVTAQFPAEQMA